MNSVELHLHVKDSAPWHWFSSYENETLPTCKIHWGW